jgi:hypothetical protein
MKSISEDLRSLFESSERVESGFRLSQKIGFVMNESDLDELLTNLSNSTLNLKDLVDDSDALHQIKQTGNDSRGKNYAKALYTIQRHANTLFRALTASWDLKCHPTHDTMLCLEDRCKGRHSASIARPAGFGKGAVEFVLLFLWHPEQSDANTPSWHETSISIVEDHLSRILFPEQ